MSNTNLALLSADYLHFVLFVYRIVCFISVLQHIRYEMTQWLWRLMCWLSALIWVCLQPHQKNSLELQHFFYAELLWVKGLRVLHCSSNTNTLIWVIVLFNLQFSGVQSQNIKKHHFPNTYRLHCVPACHWNHQQQIKPMIKNHLIQYIQLMVKFWLRLRPRSATVNTCRERQENASLQVRNNPSVPSINFNAVFL